MSNTTVSQNEIARWVRSTDNSEIQMLVGRAISYRDKMDVESIRDKVFAINHPEVRIELGESGGYEGPDHVRAYLNFWADFFTRPDGKRGWMDFQDIAEPIITFSEDGERARGMWPFFCPQAKEAMPHGADERVLTALWVCGKYDIEFIRINGTWKILKLQQIFYLRTPYDLGWVKQADCLRILPFHALAPDTPPRHYYYRPDAVYSGDGLYTWGPFMPDSI